MRLSFAYSKVPPLKGSGLWIDFTLLNGDITKSDVQGEESIGAANNQCRKPTKAEKGKQGQAGAQH